MKKYISLILAALAIANVIYSFIVIKQQSLFGFDIDIWAYRAIWSVFAVIFIYNFFNNLKKERAGLSK